MVPWKFNQTFKKKKIDYVQKLIKIEKVRKWKINEGNNWYFWKKKKNHNLSFLRYLNLTLQPDVWRVRIILFITIFTTRNTI